MPKVTCAVAVYGAEKFIEKCARSLFEQTLEDMEFLFVNDCTPDNSMGVLNRVVLEYPERIHQIKIFNLAVNQGQAAVRNLCLEKASGEYLIFCDPDDWVDKTLYKTMYDAAKESNVDVVQCDYTLEMNDCSVLQNVNQYKNSIDILRSGSFYSLSLCFHLIKNSVVKESGLRTFEGLNSGEDLGYLGRLFTLPLTVTHILGPVYHYNKANECSATAHFHEDKAKAMLQDCLRLLKEYYAEHNIPLSEMSTILRWMRDQKNSYLQIGLLKRWLELFPEVCDWECRQPDSSYFYKMAYSLSHRFHSTIPMTIFLKINQLLR